MSDQDDLNKYDFCNDLCFFETLQVKNALARNIEWHQQRIQHTWDLISQTHELHGSAPSIKSALEHERCRDLLDQVCGISTPEQRYRLRLDWQIRGKEALWLFDSFVCTQYQTKQITSLVCIEKSNWHHILHYPYKNVDRRQFTDPPFEWSTRRAWKTLGPNEELIFTESSYLLQARFANIVLELPNGDFLSPSRPIHTGTCLRRLLADGIVRMSRVSLADFQAGAFVHLVNALNDLSTIRIPVAHIRTWPVDIDYEFYTQGVLL